MNRRYRRQMMLKSRAHRRGEPIGCGCHRRRWTIRPSFDREIEVTICEPSWTPKYRGRPIRTLPDLSNFQAGMDEMRRALAGVEPVIRRTVATMHKFVEVYSDAQSVRPES